MQQRAANLATKRARPAAHTGVTLTEPMTLAGLRRAARSARIRDNAYKLQGARDETYCIAHEREGWVVGCLWQVVSGQFAGLCFTGAAYSERLKST